MKAVVHSRLKKSEVNRIKSSIFQQAAKFGQRPCLFHISNIGIKNKLSKQTVKILMRRLIRSRLIWIYTVCKCVSDLPDVRIYPTLHYHFFVCVFLFIFLNMLSQMIQQNIVSLFSRNTENKYNVIIIKI